MIEYLAVFIIGIYMLMQINNMSLLSTVAESYTTFYYRTLITGLISVVGMVVFGIWYFSVDPLGLGFRGSIIITAAFTVFLVLMTWSGNQIWPVPMAFQEPMSVSPVENYVTSSIIPGFSEDLLFLASFPMILILFYALAKMLLGFGGEMERVEFLVVAVVACLIASTGYSVWLVPGFTTSHIPAYGQVQNAYAGAWIFSTGQSMIYVTTGIFAPLPHILHNAIVTYQSLYMVVVT